MSGQDAIRGFSVQTLICILDAFKEGASEWLSVTLEPDISGDKVDLFWEYDGFTLAQQVKSSKNQIGRAAVEGWCEDLSLSRSADRYQLILAGPIAAAVLENSPYHGVEVPTPTSMDTLALIDQAITGLDRYLSRGGYPHAPLSVREGLISVISARLLDGSIRAQRFTKVEFDGWLHQSILFAYPRAVEQRMSANCDVLWNSIQLSGPGTLSRQAFNLGLPLTIINSGISVAVVEWVILRVHNASQDLLYRSDIFLRGTGDVENTIGGGTSPFVEFAINPGSAYTTWIGLIPVEKAGFTVEMWAEGFNELDLWVKFSALADPRKVKSASIFITIDDRSVLSSQQIRTRSLSSIDSFLESI